tara:strand:+ start:215 stop:718 length:504 start_codon:yes stop_codon:yes gene_type:complete
MANGTKTKLRTKTTRTEEANKWAPEKEITTRKKEKTTKRGTKTKTVERVNGKKTFKKTTKKSGEYGPGKTVKSKVKTQHGTGKDKIKSETSFKVKQTKSGKGSTYESKKKKEENSKKRVQKIKEYAGTKSKGTSTYTKSKTKEKGKKRTEHGSYVGSGTGKRRTGKK